MLRGRDGMGRSAASRSERSSSGGTAVLYWLFIIVLSPLMVFHRKNRRPTALPPRCRPMSDPEVRNAVHGWKPVVLTHKSARQAIMRP